jgi:hypothetical protein
MLNLQACNIVTLVLGTRELVHHLLILASNRGVK